MWSPRVVLFSDSWSSPREDSFFFSCSSLASGAHSLEVPSRNDDDICLLEQPYILYAAVRVTTRPINNKRCLLFHPRDITSPSLIDPAQSRKLQSVIRFSVFGPVRQVKMVSGQGENATKRR